MAAGTIRKRGDNYYVRTRVRIINPQTGAVRWKQVEKVAGSSKREAQKLLRTLQGDVDDGRYVPTAMTVLELGRKWLREHVQPNLKPGAAANYKGTFYKLGQGGHDPRRLVVEVYDDAQPASRIEVAAIEVLAAGNCILDAMIGVSDGAENEVNLVHELGAAERKVLMGAGVEHDEAAVRVGRAGSVRRHAPKLRGAADGPHGAEAVDVYSHLLPQRAHEAARRMRSVSHNPAHILPTNDDGLPASEDRLAA